jgi:uncharacterized protein (DUF433 family)
MSTIATTHIEIDDQGVAWVADTRVKVIEVAIDKLAHGSSPEEIHFQYPHLSLAQVHAALAYYYDHQTELDAEIERRLLAADEIVSRASDTTFRRKLMALKEAASLSPSTRTCRRMPGGDMWHFCKNCTTFPSTNYEEKAYSDEMAGGLCDECLAINRSGSCRP